MVLPALAVPTLGILGRWVGATAIGSWIGSKIGGQKKSVVEQYTGLIAIILFAIIVIVTLSILRKRKVI